MPVERFFSAGFQLAYEDHGSGPAVLFIHGFPLCREMWRPQISALKESGYRVLVPDLRGFGESDTPDGHYSMDDYADDMSALLEHLNIKYATIVGMSMGGYVLFNLLARYPHLVNSAAFVVTRSVADDEAGRKRRVQLADEVMRLGPQVTANLFSELLFAPETAAKRPRLLEEVYAWMVNSSSKGLAEGLLSMGGRVDSTPMLSSIKAPSLVVAAGNDKACPPELCRMIADGIADSEYMLFPDAGHMVNLEQPNDFNSCLLAFLKKVAPTKQNQGSYSCSC